MGCKGSQVRILSPRPILTRVSVLSCVRLCVRFAFGQNKMWVAKLMLQPDAKTVALLPIIFLAGCASIVDGETQVLSVKTVAVQGDDVNRAACTLVNNKGTWYVTTPGTVYVHRSYQDLHFVCNKKGLGPGVSSVASSTKAMAFGNIVFGGLIGTGIDMGTGSAYDYPSLITVQMGEATIPPQQRAVTPDASADELPTVPESPVIASVPIYTPVVQQVASHDVGATFKSGGRGLVVTKLDKNGPAARAGLEVGDVITHVNDEVIGSIDHTTAVGFITNSGSVVKVTIAGKGSRLVKLDSR